MPPKTSKSPRPDEVLHELTDPWIMRALAHPVRLGLLEALTLSGSPLTATQAGEAIGQSATTCSFHLRQLAKYGFVEEAGSGPGRRRPWRLTGVGMRFSTVSEDPEMTRAAAALELVLRERYFARYQTWLETRHAYPAALQQAATTDEYLVYATPEELRAVEQEIEAVVARYRRRLSDRSERPPLAVPFEILLLAYPIQPPSAEP